MFFLKQATFEQSTINAAKIFLQSPDADSAMEEVLALVLDYYQGERSYLYGVNLELGTMTNDYEVCATAIESHILSQQDLPLQLVSRWLSVFESQNYLYIDNVEEEISAKTAEGQILREQKVNNLLVCAIFDHGTLQGFMGVDNYKAHPHEYDLLEVVASFLGQYFNKRQVAVHMAETVTQLQQSLDISQMMFQCAQILLADSNTDVAITRLLELTAKYMGAESAYVFEYDRSERLLTNQLLYQNSSLPRQSLEKQQEYLNDIHLSPTLATEIQDFFCEDFFHLQNPQRASDSPLIQDKIFLLLDTDHCILAPFQKKGEFQGFLGINKAKTNRSHRKVITTVSAFIVNTLEKRGFLHKLEYFTNSDQLNSLKNRQAYLQKIKEWKRHSQGQLGIISVDINEFRAVNDLLGQEEGDALLLWAVKLLQSCVRDPIYRIGGDEFVCFLPGISKEGFEKRINKLNSAQNRMCYPNLAIGTTWSNQVEDLDEEIFLADKALFQNKEVCHKRAREGIVNREDKIVQLEARMKEIKRIHAR